jgi:hypothetical protein
VGELPLFAASSGPFEHPSATTTIAIELMILTLAFAAIIMTGHVAAKEKTQIPFLTKSLLGSNFQHSHFKRWWPTIVRADIPRGNSDEIA